MTIIAKDSFNRANSSYIGSAETGQKWVLPDGGSLENYYGIKNNEAIPQNAVPACIDIGAINNYTYSLKANNMMSQNQFIWHFKDTNNYYAFWMGYIIQYSNGDIRLIADTGFVFEEGKGENFSLKIVVNENTHKFYVDNILKATFTANVQLGNKKLGFFADSFSKSSFDDFLVETTEVAPDVPPVPTIVSISKSKISPKPLMNQSIIKVKFDQDVSEYVAKLGGVSYDTGVTVHTGSTVNANVEADVIIDWNELATEGENIITVYGRAKTGMWTVQKA